jgi:hypothetical protein
MEKGTKMVGKIPSTRVPVTRLRRELYTLHAALGVKTLIIYIYIYMNKNRRNAPQMTTP